MTDTRTISPADALAIAALSADFGHLVDRGRATECEALFAPDARLIFGIGSPRPGTLEGLEAIRAFLIAREAQTHVTTRHVATNFRLRRISADQIEAESLLTVFRSEDETRAPSISVVAEVVEIFRQSGGGGWVIQQRLTTPVFLKP